MDLTPETVQLLAREQLERIKASGQSAARAAEQATTVNLSESPEAYAQALQLAKARFMDGARSIEELKQSLATWHTAQLKKQSLSTQEQQDLFKKLSSTSTSLPSQDQATLNS